MHLIIKECKLTEVEKILNGEYGENVQDAFVWHRLRKAKCQQKELERLAAVAALGEFKKHILYEQALDYASK